MMEFIPSTPWMVRQIMEQRRRDRDEAAVSSAERILAEGPTHFLETFDGQIGYGKSPAEAFSHLVSDARQNAMAS